jgi:hypothetical protein
LDKNQVQVVVVKEEKNQVMLVVVEEEENSGLTLRN